MKSSTSVLSSNSASTHDIKPRIRDRLTSTSLMLNKYYVQVCGYNLYLNSLYSTVRYDVFILCLMKKISWILQRHKYSFHQSQYFYTFTELTVNTILRLLSRLYMQLVVTNSMMTWLEVSLFNNMKYFIIFFVKGTI